MNEVLRQEKKFAINIADGAVLGGRLGPLCTPMSTMAPRAM